MSRLPVDLVPFPSLAGLSTAGRELVARTREPFELGPRQPVIHCGQSVAGTYFVTAGDLRVFVQDAEGREKTLYHVRPGQTCILAVNAAFARVVYPAWVASGEEPTRGFILPAATYRELFATEPVLRDFTVEVLSSWVFDLMTAVEQGALRSMPTAFQWRTNQGSLVDLAERRSDRIRCNNDE